MQRRPEMDTSEKKMGCAEDEYYLHGECHKCQQCPPGQELKEDCGYGLGVTGVCVQCEARWFKGEWGSHPCRMCQTCRRLNRQEITPCTHTHNAVCGDCLLGFYSKRRLDGLQDLECLPCGPAPFRNTQCGSEEDNVVNAWSSEAPPHNIAVLATTGVAAVTMVTVLFVIMVLIYKGFSSFRNMFKGCLSPVSNSHSDTAAATVSAAAEHKVTQVAIAEAAELCQSSTCSHEINPNLCSHYCSVCESLPLVCSDLTSGIISQATALSDSPPDQKWFTHGLTTRGQYCAMDQQSAWGNHAPVECSELDFINITFPLENQTSALTQNQPPLPTHTSSSLELWGGESGGEGESVGVKTSSCGDDAAKGVTLISEPQLMERSCTSLQRVHLGSLPLWLVKCLSQKLDPVFPGVNNYQKVALQLGVPSDVLSGLQGFEHLFHFLSSTTLLTVPDLLQALRNVQRVDALLLIREYAKNIDQADIFSSEARISSTNTINSAIGANTALSIQLDNSSNGVS
ncbi:tumor necrosis factor receptor superfamily member 27 [Salminus brasiliensis]|uniref:tumor necrosis factor receptor superfamily member 27 n=1 Tax=Salminus brasiliensis TaxID=930266 RepID=UPI003B82DBE7